MDQISTDKITIFYFDKTNRKENIKTKNLQIRHYLLILLKIKKNDLNMKRKTKNSKSPTFNLLLVFGL
jgi:hypothetical protein